jgi:hypothetical protein
MRETSESRAHPLPEGVTRVGREDYAVWSLPWSIADGAPVERALVDRLEGAGVTAVALDAAGIPVAAPEDDDPVIRLVDELQSRGIPSVLYSAPADYVTGLGIAETDTRVATVRDLSAAVSVLREYDLMRRRCTSDRGRRVGQLRMPARALSLAPLCAYARGRLEDGGVPEGLVRDLLRECYFRMGEILGGYHPEEGDLVLSATVHDGRATLTLLDSGEPRENEVICPGDEGRVDRIHRFRILDRHNALVLERDLARV